MLWRLYSHQVHVDSRNSVRACHAGVLKSYEKKYSIYVKNVLRGKLRNVVGHGKQFIKQ